MKSLLLFALLLGQDHGAEVGRLVQASQYSEALLVAEGAEGTERSLLITWTRHHAGDLHGALEEATLGLSDQPDHTGLLEQAAWLSTSLQRADLSMQYARRLEQLGHPSAPSFIKDAEELMAVTEGVRSARTRAKWLLGGLTLLALLVSWWGTRPATP